ncbi:hypothetical protein ASG29_00675 [Sphingomonas sp. Leaf412]|uniref:5-oxoproline transporter, DUF979 family subunit n=1 Tax=Sphingomonas sp. Leaf412 TaxID=1736370 RepID=UPI0006FDDECD|nr:DUF979 family protein [Sphingomonas sp. Leaf412]KQT34713.1 hypothetical protein ASG29_00675 [Sphingomonas sp. Leaf412]
MIGLGFVYTVAGLVFAGVALLGAHDRRWANAAFHALIAASFLAGDRIGDLGNGLLVLALVGVATSGRMRRGEPAAEGTTDLRKPLIALALVIPACALLGTLAAERMPTLIDPKQATLVALTAGVLVAMLLCHLILRPAPLAGLRAGRRLLDEIGWAAVLPQLLASLGAVFALAGVGEVVGGLVGQAIPAGSIAGAVVAYGLGMALFTIVMGNAFAAFPVMAAAVGVPLLIRQYGGDPAPVAAVGMLAGFCGTLLTPMAANFNIVPAALLELRDRYGVIRAQVATAVPLLGFNLLLLWWVVR